MGIKVLNRLAYGDMLSVLLYLQKILVKKGNYKKKNQHLNNIFLVIIYHFFRNNICVWCKRLCYTIKQRRLREKNNKNTTVFYSPSQRKHIQEIKKVKKLLQKKCTRAAKRIDYLQNSLNSIKEQMKEMSKSKNKSFHNANLVDNSRCLKEKVQTQKTAMHTE